MFRGGYGAQVNGDPTRRLFRPLAGLTCDVAAAAALLGRDPCTALSRAHLLEDAGQVEERVLPREPRRPRGLLHLGEPGREPLPPVFESPLDCETRVRVRAERRLDYGSER